MQIPQLKFPGKMRSAAVILRIGHQVVVLPDRALLCLWNVRGTVESSRTRMNLLRTQINL